MCRPFHLKKRSSTLGINRTSESPPPLRKDLSCYSFEEKNKYASYDPHFRHTVNLGSRNKNTGSLQNMNEFSFANRNNRYRRTIQNVTPG